MRWPRHSAAPLQPVASSEVLRASPAFDAVVCVGTHDVDLAGRSLRSIRLFCRPREIFVVTARANFGRVTRSTGDAVAIRLLDEDTLIEGTTLARIADHLEQRIDTAARAGWYFQQFLKMAVCRLPDVAGHYLLWDADTVALHPLDFLSASGAALVNPRTENHLPYFSTMARLGIEKRVGFSFVAEHLLVQKSRMCKLIETLSAGANPRGWTWNILDAIDDADLGASGFSEYETYGNFAVGIQKDAFLCRTLKSTRHAAADFGHVPTRYDLFDLMRAGHAYATFELAPYGRYRDISKNKAKARLEFIRCALMHRRRHGDQLRAASFIAPE